MAGMLPLGVISVTPGADDALRRNRQSLMEFLRRHGRGDWGELSPHDRHENEIALQKGYRIMSVYHLRDGTKIWVITEADRQNTTVLLPDEY